MNVRFRTALFFLVLIGAFGLGTFLLIAADETPAPGLILMGICGVALILYLRRDAKRLPENEDFGPSPIERDREAYEQEQERKRREPRMW